MVLKSLVDSRSSNSFIDSVFVQTQHLPAYGILPIKLQLHHLTGSRLANPFSYQGIPEPDLLRHSIGPSCMIVLGYCWLTHYNPSIHWVLGSIFFQQPSQHKSKSSPSVETPPVSTPLQKLLDFVPDIPNPAPPVEPRKPLRVTLINAAAYSHASKIEGSNCFQLQISLPEVTGHSVTTSETKVDMSAIPKDYVTSHNTHVT